MHTSYISFTGQCLSAEIFSLLILLMIFFSYILFHQEAINQGPESLSKRPSRQLTVHIDRFAYIFRCAQ
jgi:hypothetical protein